MDYLIRFEDGSEAYLSHHSIKGMRWGVRNEETKARYSKRSSKKETLKKVGKGVAVGVGIGLSAYAAYKGYSHVKTKSDVTEAVYNKGRNEVTRIISGVDNLYAGQQADPFSLGKQSYEIDQAMVSRINRDNNIHSIDGGMNCFHTSCAYILNSLYGCDVTAKPMLGVDEVSGLAKPGRSKHLWHACFDGVREYEAPNNAAEIRKCFVNIPNGSTGVIRANAHYLNYEKSISGKITLIDCQSNEIRPYDPRTEPFTLKIGQTDMSVYDFSRASIKDPSLFNYLVK